MTVQFLVISSPSSRHRRNGFSVPSDFISRALISSCRFFSESKQPLEERPFTFLAYFTAAGPATNPPQMHDTSEFAPRRLAPWYWYSHSPAEYSPGMLVACWKSTHIPPIV